MNNQPENPWTDQEALESRVRTGISMFAQAFPPYDPADIAYDTKEVWGKIQWILAQHRESADALAWLIGDLYTRVGMLALMLVPADSPIHEE